MLHRSLWEKGKSGFSSLNRNKSEVLFSLLIIFLPTQFGKHFWPDFAYLLGFRIDYLSPTLFFTDCLVLLLFLSVLLAKQKRLQCQDFFSRHKLFFLLLGVLLIVNTCVALSLPLAVYGDVKLLEFLFVGIYAAGFIRRSEIPRLTFLLVISGTGESILAIWQHIWQRSVGGIFYLVGERQFTAQTPGIANASVDGHLILRPYGTLPHPNVLAGFLLSALIFAVFLLKRFSGAKRALVIVFLGLGSVALLLSLSRMVIILWILLTLWWTLSLAWRKLGKKWILGFCLGILLLGTLLLLRFFPDAVIRLVGTRLSETAITTRIVLLSQGLTLVSRHPLLGVGLDNMLPALAALSPKEYPWQLQPVHMIYLAGLIEVGVMGMLFFLYFLVLTIKRCSVLIKEKSMHLQLPIVLAFVCLLAIGFVDHYSVTLQQGQLLFSVMAGLIWIRK